MNKQTQQLLDYLQKRRRIEILMLMYSDEDGIVLWSDVKEKLQVADCTFRSACNELVSLGLATKVPINCLKNSYSLTDFGCLVASLINEKVQDLNTLVDKKVEVLSIA